MTPTADRTRLASLDGLTTSAKVIDDYFNLKASEFRIVSSNGVLFCVPDWVLGAGVFRDMKSVASVPGEIVLVDDDFEDAATLKFYLRLLHGELSDLLFARCPTTIRQLFKIMNKYGQENRIRVQLLAVIQVHRRSFGCCSAADIFLIAAQLGLHPVMNQAAQELCANYRSFEPFHIASCPPEAIRQLLNAFMMVVVRNHHKVSDIAFQ